VDDDGEGNLDSAIRTGGQVGADLKDLVFWQVKSIKSYRLSLALICVIDGLSANYANWRELKRYKNMAGIRHEAFLLLALTRVIRGQLIERIRHKDWRTGTANRRELEIYYTMVCSEHKIGFPLIRYLSANYANRREFERYGALVAAKHKKILSLIRVNLRNWRTRLFFALFAVACPVGIFSHGACTKSPTDSKGLSLSGSVKVEGQTDHSGPTMALYALAELDTAVVRMNKEYPMVGIPISQATEFACPSVFWRDRRLAQPIYQTQTKADGSYKLEDIEIITMHFA
jgi:hypothetical protein